MKIDKQKVLKSLFGTLKLKKDTQKIMKEIDEGYNEVSVAKNTKK